MLHGSSTHMVTPVHSVPLKFKSEGLYSKIQDYGSLFSWRKALIQGHLIKGLQGVGISASLWLPIGLNPTVAGREK